MTPEEKAYEEALRRIQEAERTGAAGIRPQRMKKGKIGAY